MAWVKLDDNFFLHPKARAVGAQGQLLYLASLCWAARSETGGVVPTADLPLLAATVGVKPSAARILVDAGMWEVHPDGWEIHDYLEYNPSAEEARERRRKRAEAGRKGGLRSRPPGSKPEANASANGEANGEAEAAENLKPDGTPYPNPPDLHPQTTSSGRAGTWSDERNRNSTAGHKPSSAEPTAGSQIRAAERLRQQRLVDQPAELDPDAGRAGIAAARAVLVTSEDAE